MNLNSYNKRKLNYFSIALQLIVLISLVSCSEKSDGWINLFNGEDLSNWKVKISGHDLNDNYNNTFRVKDGILIVSYDNYENFDEKFGHIFYEHKFSSYILKMDYRFIGDQVPGGPGWAFRNNGVMLHCQSPESMEKDQEFPVSIEAQLLGGNGVDERTTGNVCTPSTHYEMGGELIKDHCINSSSRTYHGDQWVTIEIEVHGNSKIIHRINGEVVFEYERPQLDEADPYAKNLIDRGHNIMLSEGYIALQAESHPTEFRNIKLKPLEKK